MPEVQEAAIECASTATQRLHLLLTNVAPWTRFRIDSSFLARGFILARLDCFLQKEASIPIVEFDLVLAIR